jgi:hypothetical protein
MSAGTGAPHSSVKTAHTYDVFQHSSFGKQRRTVELEHASKSADENKVVFLTAKGDEDKQYKGCYLTTVECKESR